MSNGKQNDDELSITLPQSAGIAVYPPGATFGPRRMGEFEFVWIVEGDCKFIQDGVIYDAPPGAIILCRPKTIDEFHWDVRRKTRHGYFHFHLPSIPQSWPPVEEWPARVLAVEDDVLVSLFRFILAWAGRGDRAMIHSAIATMLRAMIAGQRSLGELAPDVPPDPVERAMAYIHRAFAADTAAVITLDDLASAACVTPAYLCRVFKRTLDLSPAECVRLARLDRAAVLLSRSNLSVGTIAGLCGFASQFHFARLFKRSFKQTPTELRRRIRAGTLPAAPRLLPASIRRPQGQKQA